MSSDTVITIENLSKKYTIRHQNGRHRDGLRHVLQDLALTPWRWLKNVVASNGANGDGNSQSTNSDPYASRSLLPAGNSHRPAPRSQPPAASSEDFWALRDVNLEVKRGEVVGIIGRNGAGKSTLLKILSRITEPTEGQVRIKGRVASLLEVGTGFHPELTGRENIFLNGAILGMNRAEIKRKFDEIVAFAETEKFLDTPVKRYSSGMYVRLAFAVAAHLEPEILIVDEVLAVGDGEFQKKCLGKMHDVATCGRTVLFVSHNMQAVSILCNRALFLRSDSVPYTGSVKDATDLYISSFLQSPNGKQLPDRRPGSGEYRFESARPAREFFEGAEEKAIDFEISCRRRLVGKMWLSAHVVDSNGTVIIQCDSRLVGFVIQNVARFSGRLRFTTPWLKPGDYRVDLFICGSSLVDSWEGACSFMISPVIPYPHSADKAGTAAGLVFSDFNWENHHILANGRSQACVTEKLALG
jgi:homopolymeric O-antigen transport system ATP-binding protein